MQGGACQLLTVALRALAAGMLFCRSDQMQGQQGRSET